MQYKHFTRKQSVITVIKHSNAHAATQSERTFSQRHKHSCLNPAVVLNIRLMIYNPFCDLLCSHTILSLFVGKLRMRFTVSVLTTQIYDYWNIYFEFAGVGVNRMHLKVESIQFFYFIIPLYLKSDPTFHCFVNLLTQGQICFWPHATHFSVKFHDYRSNTFWATHNTS
jgi:hypothetical protein